MGEYPTGSKKFTASGLLGTEGVAQRVFSVTTYSHASSTAVISLYNGGSASSTVNVYWQIYGVAGTGSYEEIGTGLLFPNGCYVSLGATSGAAYAVVNYAEELI